MKYSVGDGRGGVRRGPGQRHRPQRRRPRRTAADPARRRPRRRRQAGPAPAARQRHRRRRPDRPAAPGCASPPTSAVPAPLSHRHQPRHQRPHRHRQRPGHLPRDVCGPGRLRGRGRPDPGRHPAQPQRRPAARRGARRGDVSAARSRSSPTSSPTTTARAATSSSSRRSSRPTSRGCEPPSCRAAGSGSRPTARSTGDAGAARQHRLRDQRRHQDRRRPRVRRPEAAARRSRSLPNVEDDEAIGPARRRRHDPGARQRLDVGEGIPLKLDPPAVKVVAGKGQAFASGQRRALHPRRQAPITADDVVDPRVRHLPRGQLRDRAVTGRITVTDQAAARRLTTPNQPPTARSFSASVTAGDTLAITVPTSGIDPDGDLTFVSGIVGEDGKAVDLYLGRVTRFGAATIKYEAYPRSAGTEVIRYAAPRPVRRDERGRSSASASSSPATRSRPIAVQDDIVAAPGRTVHADVLANDLIAAGDSVTFVDLATLNDADVLKQFQQAEGRHLQGDRARGGPGQGARPTASRTASSTPPKSTLTVRGQKEFNNPPTARRRHRPSPSRARPRSSSTRSPTTVTSTVTRRRLQDRRSSSATASTARAGKVRIQLRPQARVVPYVIEDADGAKAMALIYVPTGDNGAPYVTPARSSRWAPTGTATSTSATTSPTRAGGKVTVTSPDTVSDVAQGRPAVRRAAERHLAQADRGHDYIGPAALMLQVTERDRSGRHDGPDGIRLDPVQIGPDVPILRCPDYLVNLVGGGPAAHLRHPAALPRLAADRAGPGTASTTASWDPAVDRRRPQARPAPATARSSSRRSRPPGGRDAVPSRSRPRAVPSPFTIRVRGRQPPPPRSRSGAARCQPIEGLIAGTSRTVNIAQYLDSPLTSPQCSVAVGHGAVSGTGVTRQPGRLPGHRHGVRQGAAATRASRCQAVDAPGTARGAAARSASVIRSKPDPMRRTGRASADRILGEQRAGRLSAAGLRRRSADPGLRGHGDRTRRRRRPARPRRARSPG